MTLNSDPTRSDVIEYNTDKEDWLRLTRHLFDFPTTVDKEMSRKFAAVNFDTNNMLDEIEKMTQAKSPVLSFFHEIEKILGNLPVVKPERYHRHTLYTSNPDPVTNMSWKGKGPCKWKYNPIVAKKCIPSTTL